MTGNNDALTRLRAACVEAREAKRAALGPLVTTGHLFAAMALANYNFTKQEYGQAFAGPVSIEEQVRLLDELLEEGSSGVIDINPFRRDER